MKLRNLFYFLNILGLLVLFSAGSGHTMMEEGGETFGSHRVQVFSIMKSPEVRLEHGHTRFDELASRAPIIHRYPAFLLEEKGDETHPQGRIYGQLQCANEAEANELATHLDKILVGHNPVIVEPLHTSAVYNLSWEAIIRHHWGENKPDKIE